MILRPDLPIPCWQVDNKTYFNRFETWLAIGKSKNATVKFDFYDTIFDSVDWTKEPTQTWDDLVKQRCLQLRSKYSHLALMYSAGRDSHHILRSFATNKIPIDEIIIEDFTLNSFKHKEVDPWMIPLANQYKQDHNPACKISRINVGREDYEEFFHETWSEGSRAITLQGQFQPGNHPWLVEKHLGMWGSGTGVIMGIDKPRLFWENGWICDAFYDSIFDWFTGSNMAYEFFYYTPDLPQLHIKQCHMVINWWEQYMPNLDHKTMTDFITDPKSGYYDDYNLACGRGPAVDLNFQGQNGHNKYFSSNHATFQIIQREAKKQKWASYFHWKESFDWIKKNVSNAFDNMDEKYGFKDPTYHLKIIKGKTRALRRWQFQTQLT